MGKSTCIYQEYTKKEKSYKGIWVSMKTLNFLSLEEPLRLPNRNKGIRGYASSLQGPILFCKKLFYFSLHSPYKFY